MSVMQIFRKLEKICDLVLTDISRAVLRLQSSAAPAHIGAVIIFFLVEMVAVDDQINPPSLI